MSNEPTRLKHKLAEARSYDVDFHAWADAQASKLRQLQPAGLDWRNLIEELEGMARSDERALESFLAVLLIHLLKYRYERNKRSGSWEASIENSRDQIDYLLERSPSLVNKIGAAFPRAYRLARRRAGAEMGLRKREWEAKLPASCEWRLEQVRDSDFWPD